MIILTALTALLLSCSGTDRARETVRRHIAASWENTIRSRTEDTADSLIGLPRPYTVPCEDGMFNELYYWDTFFTNEGLIADGRAGLARDNTDDILYLIDRYGFMPNGNRLWYLSRSQPPFAALMVSRVFAATADTAWLSKAYPTLCREYEFWQTCRQTPVGLNRYGGSADEKLLREFIVTAGRRLGDDFQAKGWTEEELLRFGEHCVAECESGWDFNPRFSRRCEDFCPVDLNAILYGAETEMAGFSRILKTEEADLWESRAQHRKELMMKYFYDADKKAFFDYDYARGERSDVISAAPFSLLFTRALDREAAEAVRGMLTHLEYPAGIAATADADYPYTYQWSFPNTWPPLNYMAVAGLREYGYETDARRIAGKWLDATAALFKRTGKLWEKMTCTDGAIPDGTEYGTPSMLGWTAGTFVCFDEYLRYE